MPQMTQILLSNVEPGRENGGVKPSPSDVSAIGGSKLENNDFSEALARVSAKDVTQSQTQKGADAQVEADKSGDDSIFNQVQDELSNQPKKSGDVANVLAQIDLASKLGADAETGTEIAADGAILPPDDSEADMAVDDELMPSIVKGLAGKLEKADAELEEIVTLAPPGVTPPEVLPVITPNGQGVANEAIVAQLAEESLVQIIAQSGLTKEELMALPPQMLQALIHGVEGLGSQAAKGQNAASQLIADQSGDEAVLSAQQDIKTLIVQAKQYLAANGVQSGSVLVAPSQQQGEALAAGLAAGKEANSILGDAKPNGMKPSAEPSRQAEIIAASSTPTRGVKAAVDALKDANLAVSMTPKVSDDTDIAGLDKSGFDKSGPISTQSFTGLRVESTPQYQLSIRPQGEPAAQMQEMIQKFSPVMRQQLVAMVSQGVQQAEIRLDPPELGHMMVRIQVQGEHTQVQFHVAQTQTRDLVEQAIPRLREMLAEQGMQLTDSNVSQGGRDQGNSAEQGDTSRQGLSDMDEISAEESLLVSNNATSYRSGIDYYA